jgi:hypothetical protein
MRAVALLLLALTIPLEAHADTCKEAFSRSSRLVGDGKLAEAKKLLRECAAEGCPAAMRPLCVHDLEALEPRIPTVVVSVNDRATPQDPVDVEVLVDGVRLQSSLDGKAREVDPGLHEFRFDRGGRVSVLSLLIREGEKDRVIAVDWPSPALESASASRRPIPTVVWLTGGLTVAAAVVWATTGINGFVKESQLDSCKAMDCPKGEVDTTQTMFNVADVAGGTTLALGTLTTLLFLTRPSIISRTAASVTWTGRQLVIGGTF